MRSIVLLFGLTIALSAHSQEKVIEEAIGWHGTDIELHAFSDTEKNQSCLMLCNGDSVRAFVLDKNKTILQRFYFTRIRGEEFLGGFIKDGRAYAYFQPPSTSILHELTLIIADGVANDAQWPIGARHERLVEKMSCGDHFLYITANKKTSQIGIYELRGGKGAESLHYSFEEGVWKALTTANFWGRELNIASASPEDMFVTGWAHVHNKLYTRGDTLFLLMNKLENGVTAVYSFDLRAPKVDFRKITHNHVAMKDSLPPVYQDNSMLLDDKLYFVSAEAVKLDVQIRDFHSGSLLKEFSARRDESIPFMNTPIVQDESLYHAKSPKPQTTAELLYRMTDGSAKLIAIPEDSGRVGLTIGSWKELTKSRPSGPPLGPGGMMTVNVYTITQETRFRMLVDPTTLQHAPGPLTTDIWDRVGQYNRTMSIPPKGFCLFVNGGRWAYTYYNRDKHSIELALF